MKSIFITALTVFGLWFNVAYAQWVVPANAPQATDSNGYTYALSVSSTVIGTTALVLLFRQPGGSEWTTVPATTARSAFTGRVFSATQGQNISGLIALDAQANMVDVFPGATRAEQSRAFIQELQDYSNFFLKNYFLGSGGGGTPPTISINSNSDIVIAVNSLLGMRMESSTYNGHSGIIPQLYLK